MWLVVIGPLVASLIATAATLDLNALQDLGAGDEDSFRRFAETHPWFAASSGLAIAALTWSILAAPLLYPVFQAMVLRWWASGLRFGDAAVTSHLRIGEVYGTYLRFIGWSIVFGTIGTIAILLVGVVIGLGIWSSGLDSALQDSQAGQITAAIVGVAVYVIFALGYSAIYQVKVRLGLWRSVVNSSELSNPTTLERISSVGAPASPVGEGLADALNVGGF
jgi:uncharacterized membrane protein YjgN (DUF898 family)